MAIKKNLLVFGVGPSADVAADLFEESGNYNLLGFVLDKKYVTSEQHGGFPVFAYEDVRANFSPSDCDIFVAVGYRNLNRLRSEVWRRVTADGFFTPTFIQSPAEVPPSVKVGSNCLIMTGASIHPRVSIGDDVFIWAGATVCHHSKIGSHVWITAGATIAGNCSVGNHIFIGANATIANDLALDDECFVGAGSFVGSNLGSQSVVIRPADELFRLSADQFLELAKSKGF